MAYLALLCVSSRSSTPAPPHHPALPTFLFPRFSFCSSRGAAACRHASGVAKNTERLPDGRWWQGHIGSVPHRFSRSHHDGSHRSCTIWRVVRGPLIAGSAIGLLVRSAAEDHAGPSLRSWDVRTSLVPNGLPWSVDTVSTTVVRLPPRAEYPNCTLLPLSPSLITSPITPHPPLLDEMRFPRPLRRWPPSLPAYGGAP